MTMADEVSFALLADGVTASDLLTWRALLAGQALFSLLMFGGMLGHFWRKLHWPLRLLGVGAMGVGVYVLAGQAKAYNLGIPFDGYSQLGVGAYALVIVGLLAVRRVERKRIGEA